jgi:ubiquinone/menaquinone biosynthesis C-methylase UbiE
MHMRAVVEHRTNAQDAYVLGRTQREYERLTRQARIWEPATRQALQLAGLGAGHSAVDVGCGPCDVMKLMAERVGHAGRVVGMDVDAVLAGHAIEQLSQSGPDVYSFIAGDITEVTQISQAPFDLVFARLLLFHLDDPAAALRRLWDWVRPGGALLIMDYDITVTRSAAQIPVIERTLRLCNDTFRRCGRDIEIGTRIPSLFIEADIGIPDACNVASVMLPAGPSTHMLSDLLDSLRPQILRHRLADERALTRLEFDLRAAESSDSFMRWPDLTATWKRKPPSDVVN